MWLRSTTREREVPNPTVTFVQDVKGIWLFAHDATGRIYNGTEGLEDLRVRLKGDSQGADNPLEHEVLDMSYQAAKVAVVGEQHLSEGTLEGAFLEREIGGVMLRPVDWEERLKRLMEIQRSARVEIVMPHRQLHSVVLLGYSTSESPDPSEPIMIGVSIPYVQVG